MLIRVYMCTCLCMYAPQATNNYLCENDVSNIAFWFHFTSLAKDLANGYSLSNEGNHGISTEQN